MNIYERKAVIDTITEMYDKIFQAEKKVADVILNNPDIALSCNVSELANHSGVSDATVIRLCKHLGYDGYHQMKICLSRDMGRRDETIKEHLNEENSTMAGIFKEIAERIIVAGVATDERVFKKCIELIKNATMVHLVAIGNTIPLCVYNGPRMQRMGIRCTYSMMPEHYLNHINLAPETDIVLAISGSGTSRDVVNALQLAKDKGLKTIAITGYKQSPVSQLADYLLLSASGTLGGHRCSQSSRLNELAVMEALILALDHVITAGTDLTEPERILSATKL